MSDFSAKDVLLGFSTSSAKYHYQGWLKQVPLRAPGALICYFDVLSELTGNSRNVLLVKALEASLELIVESMTPEELDTLDKKVQRYIRQQLTSHKASKEVGEITS